MATNRWVIAAGCWLLSLSPLWGQQPPALMLFGGSDHKTYLGCINCNKAEATAVCNKYGQYGSKYNAESIWNRYGTYGSKYSQDSPWNKYSATPPIIVDNSGASYGYFTSNRYMAGRTQIAVLNQLADIVGNGADLNDARDIYCGN